MVVKVNKIKKLGIFNDYTPISTLKDFKKFNLVYGWNGSGKTTFSKLFDALEVGSHSDYPDLEFEVLDDASNKYVQGQTFSRKVRVFNQDYIEKNLSIRDGKTKAITLVLGNTSQEVLEQLEKDEVELSLKNTDSEKETVLLDNKEKTKGKTFTEIAKTIYIAITGGAIRTYNKNNAEADFVKITEKTLLSKDDLDALSITVKQFQKPFIDPLVDITFELTKEEEKVDLSTYITGVATEAKSLLFQCVESIVIEHLRDNPDISTWVESGLELHQVHASENCEFCGQKISADRIQNFAKYFNEADKLLKQNLENTIIKISNLKEIIKSSCVTPDDARFYEQFTSEYKTANSNLSTQMDSLLIDLEKIVFSLKEKKTKTTESIELGIVIDVTKFNDAFQKVNNFIRLHNKKTADFETAKVTAIEKIKVHYLSTIFDEIKKLEIGIQNHKNRINLLANGDPMVAGDLGTIQLRQRISENRAKISSTHKACANLNQGLDTFLGRQELVFEPSKKKVTDEKGITTEIDDGYVIKRNEKIVTHLSEGEKTAIAFVYFTIHLNDPAFDKNKDIVVIDDPISSLDSNSIFQAFSFLKNAVKDMQQVFFLTHNFDFLRLVLNWLKHPSLKRDSSFYMIKNKDTVDGREAFLDELDKDLQEFESEYNYLFKLLLNFQSTGTIASVYHMPNIARKVLETFLMFRVPNSENLYTKLESLKPLFDENKITAIYKFTNDQSHITGKGFDPCLIPETQKVVKELLELIEVTFPEHYKILVTS